MSFVNQGIKFINSIYDNYFDSNAKITLNDNEMKQDSEYDKQKQGYENNEDYNMNIDASQLETINNETPAHSTHKYNTRSKINSNNYNSNNNNRNNYNSRSKLFIDTSFQVENKYTSLLEYNKHDYRNKINNQNGTPRSEIKISPRSCSSSSPSSPEERILHLENTIKGLEMSINNSKTAKGGLIEEEKVLRDLNGDSGLSTLFFNTFLPEDNGNGDGVGVVNNAILTKFRRHPNSVCKTDIVNVDRNILIQIKRYDVKCCYGQIDRHWVDDFVQEIPDIKQVSFMLRNLCEIPLIPGTNIVDKEVGRIPLSLDNYSDIQLRSLLTKLNDNIKAILHFVLKGNNQETSPSYLMGIEYKNEERVKTIVYKMSDVIETLSKKFQFRINSRATVISLGDIISIQRKGGDNGLRSSNQLQWKLRFTSLSSVIPSSKRLEYFF
jgi:hypothetical protein